MGWLINGTMDGAGIGATYEIRFTWNDVEKTIAWSPIEEPSAGAIPKRPYEHQYFIAGSWTNFKLQPMIPRERDVVANWYDTTLRIGSTGEEEFQIVRDRDWGQT